MYLKTLTLKGFKSFADTTVLDLEPGITVVVGPNGSGKSNIVDAVAWVLGAQGPRTVRSSKMDDVIFAGSAKRPALGRAEVHLTIDNASGMLPIEFSEVTISRTLFRNGDSEYAINGVPSRLLDVQDLLSDSGVGRQQHVIVGQGQLDAVLNARPEDRRQIIEEAAGILKFRKRKERAQRRLDATEANLLRLSDLLREVRRQLRPLERQAEAARRHGDLVSELAAIRLHVAGRELATLRGRLAAGAEGRARLAGDDAATRAELAGHDATVLAAEAELSAMGADDLGEGLVQVERLHQQARGLAAVLAERRRGIERDRAVAADRGVIESLEAEAARLRAELAEAEQAEAALAPAAARLAEAEADLAGDRSAFESRWPDGAPSGAASAASAAEARGELAALSSATARGETEAGRLEQRLASLTEKIERLAAEGRDLREARSAGESSAPTLDNGLMVAEGERIAAEHALEAAETALRAAEGDHRAWTARAEALAQALDDARARAGAARLEGHDGVLGTLLDLVEVDPGWEAAFEAAAGSSLGSVVVGGGVDGARRALEVLAEAGAGAVLPLLAGPVRHPSPVPGGEAVRTHVRGRSAEVDALLDALLAGAVCVAGGWAAALDAAVDHPGAVVVTRDGDRFAPGGWLIGGRSSGATGAALDEATSMAAGAANEAALARSSVAIAREAVDGARRAEAEWQRHLAGARAAVERATEALVRVDAESADALAEADAVRTHLAELADRVARERERASQLQAQLPGLEDEERRVGEEARQVAETRRRIDERSSAVAALRSDLEVR
ncbi:MAG: chromosome segregation SMC family protein, partial [Acidimicrobiia bacterium]